MPWYWMFGNGRLKRAFKQARTSLSVQRLEERITPATVETIRNFLAFDPTFAGGVRIATGDENGDGASDIIAAAGPGATPHVKVFDGRTLTEIRSFLAYGDDFRGGISVAAGDVNGDGTADIITGSGAGSAAHIKAFDGKTGLEIRSFTAFSPSFLGGVNVAAADVTGDGIADIIAGAGAGGGPQVTVFDGKTGAEVRSFYAFDSTFFGGVNNLLGGRPLRKAPGHRQLPTGRHVG